MDNTKSIAVSRRAVSFAAAAGLALAGTVTLASGQLAGAEEMQQGDKVWVCKFVGKPFESELLKGGKNPIEVAWQTADKDKDGNVSVGDEFPDAQGQSVVVQINGEDPGVEACMKTPPPTTTTTTKPPKTTTTQPPKTTTSTPPATTTTKPPKTTPPATATTKPSGGAGGGVAPGVGAPDTGAAGETSPAGTLLGAGLLLAAGGVLAAEATRRRRELAED